MTYTLSDVLSLRNAVQRLRMAEPGITSISVGTIEAEVQTYILAQLDPKEVVNHLHQRADRLDEQEKARRRASADTVRRFGEVPL